MYTKGGDKGETGLRGPKRVPKDSARVEAYGTVDELNSCVGVAVSECKDNEISEALRDVQKLLFVAGADLASEASAKSQDRTPRIRREDTQLLERRIDEMQRRLPRLVKFILPGGSRLSAQIHLARAVCRRAERRIITVSKVEEVNPEIIPFFNRLSTYFFNLARYSNQKEGREDELWEA